MVSSLIWISVVVFFLSSPPPHPPKKMKLLTDDDWFLSVTFLTYDVFIYKISIEGFTAVIQFLDWIQIVILQSHISSSPHPHPHLQTGFKLWSFSLIYPLAPAPTSTFRQDSNCDPSVLYILHPPTTQPSPLFFFFLALHSPSCEEIEMAVLCTWITLSIECFVQNFSCTVAKQNRALCFCSLKLFMVLNVCFKIVLFVLGWPSMVDRVIESKQPKTNSFHY